MKYSIAWKRSAYSIIFCAATLASTLVHAQMAPASLRPVGVFGTGHLAHSELLAPLGTADGNFTYVSCPNNFCTTTPFVTLTNQYPFPLWLPDTEQGQWIGPDVGGNENTTDPSGDYQYRQIFDLTGFDLKTVWLYGAFACDNSCYLALNGTIIFDITNNSFSDLKPFAINRGFKPGLNRLDFSVNNQVQSVDNPTGLFVEMYGEGQHAAEPK